ncbi:MAG: Ig-like domain-containing protein [Planctomycetes bacterium]|nr:Ig-like domain-containing protein [Planctomycetota bacterium]
MLSVLLSALLQSIEPQPSVVEVGAPTRIVVTARDGRVLAGIPVVARAPDGAVLQLGATDAEGVVRLTPAVVGTHTVVATLEREPGRGALTLRAALDAVPERRRPLWFGLGTLLAVAAGWRAFRRGPETGRAR